jgi:hypothetical protein
VGAALSLAEAHVSNASTCQPPLFPGFSHP